MGHHGNDETEFSLEIYHFGSFQYCTTYAVCNLQLSRPVSLMLKSQQTAALATQKWVAKEYQIVMAPCNGAQIKLR